MRRFRRIHNSPLARRMKKRPNSALSLKKEPQQRRSKALVEAVLTAATRILNREGAAAFTMARIAEKAGISVGSLYQYFPNKKAVLFRLQTSEWAETTASLEALLNDTSKTPEVRLKGTIHAFFQSECAEASFRQALAQAAPAYQHTAEARAHAKKSQRIMDRFVAEVLPSASTGQRAFAADVIKTAISALGKQISEQERRDSEIEALAAASSRMLWLWLMDAKSGR